MFTPREFFNEPVLALKNLGIYIVPDVSEMESVPLQAVETAQTTSDQLCTGGRKVASLSRPRLSRLIKLAMENTISESLLCFLEAFIERFFTEDKLQLRGVVLC